MEIRNAMSLRVAMRVTAILRIGMVSLGVVTLMLLLMLYAFTSKMDAMNVEFLSMPEDMSTMRTTLSDMEYNISHVSAITLATSDITGSVDGLRIEVANMNRAVNWMSNDVNEMAAPMNSGPMSGFWPR